MSVNLEDQKLYTLIAEVQKEYEKITKSEEKEEDKKDAKAESDKKEDKDEKEKEELKKDDGKEEGPKAEDPMPEVDAKQDEHVTEELEEEMNHASVDELCEQYMGLDEDDLMAHLVAVNRALAAKMQQEKQEETAMVDQIMDKNYIVAKSQKSLISKGNKQIKQDLKKSEHKVTEKEKELQKEINALKTQMGDLVKNLERVSSQPQSHAFTGANFIAKSEPAPAKITREELIQKLSEKAQDPNLTPADRQKITKYSLNLHPSDDLKKFLNI